MMSGGTPGPEPVGPVFLAHLFPDLHAELLELLRGLEPDDWERPTASSRWNVRDVVAHLLDGDLRKISVGRDGHHAPPPAEPLDTYDRLVEYLDAFNAEWVVAARRLSPRVLVDLHELVGPQLADHLEALDPFAPAPFAVAWAGDETSPNWFDIGREYVERWHHQDQIRRAVGSERLTGPRWLAPVLEIVTRSLPHAYRDVSAGTGTAVVLDVSGTASGAWSLLRGEEGWTLHAGAATEPSCTVAADGITTAEMLLSGLAGEQRDERVTIEGDRRLAEPVFAARALMVPLGS